MSETENNHEKFENWTVPETNDLTDTESSKPSEVIPDTIPDDTKELQKIREEIDTLPDSDESGVVYAPESEMDGAYGLDTNPPTIQEGLPSSVEQFVIAHERYHNKDTSTNTLWREIKANAAAARQHPIGFVRTLWKSITNRKRMQYYADRIKKGY